MTEQVKIDVAELTDARLSPDRTRLLLAFRDRSGQPVSLSLPANCLNAMLALIPRESAGDTVHPVDTWNMDPAEDGTDLVLTLRTAEGRGISFSIKPWQVEGMATVATYGRWHRAPVGSLH